ncbi:DNA adenine methylase [Deinococcus maricopensis]|uniref:D12 class N6 adenine-specific DNA methyltransferase n=1 Tax=Deinococcus maricopensis (strain DSM 21211 / LMG 22137 / NRRL B-23946 / LB-34) TaxID=709986 RepID=E8U3V6_DEIML|nr:DNA adenine methylase [Deinococcus maricopensis]ADV68799.1 D12 class N6 adenine-specific DNA methyltransferase [Deinococcus maricopensis DSM 21211]
MEANIKASNVSSSKMLSPLRYPGGKTWFVPRFVNWMSSRKKRPTLFVEPFAGGASLSCAVLDRNLADHILLVEKDERISSLWKVIFSDHAHLLAEAILEYNLTEENVKIVLSDDKPNDSIKDALYTLVRNRISRGGIMAPGAGILKHGEAGRGLHSRWYPTTLSNRILYLSQFKKRVTISNGDAIEHMESEADNKSAVFLIDPPYSETGKAAGRRLYTHWQLDHEMLFKVTQELTGDFLMTYHVSEEIKAMAHSHGFEYEAIPMKNTHHAVMSELVIGRDLSWLRSSLFI